jgi:hypothetical protein
MLNLKGPVVKITSPSAVEGQTDIAVGDLFCITGTAEGETKVTFMEIKMSYFDGGGLVAVGREWRWEHGGWDYRADSNVDWKPYSEADYSYSIDPERPVDPSSWHTEGKIVYFNIPILMDGLPVPKDYYITIGAMDAAGHRDANSTVKVKVSYDNDKPKFQVQQPLLFDGKITGGQNEPWGLLYPDYPVNSEGVYRFNTYIYDPVNMPEETYSYINEWVTGLFDFKWEIDKTMIGEYTLSFEFTNRHNLANPGAGEAKALYYRYEWDDTGIGGLLPKRGIFTDGDAPYPYIKIRGALTENDVKPRDPATGDTVSGELPKIDGKYTPVQVVSRLMDGAGNTAYKSNGWFAYFPEADRPWALIDFGVKFNPASAPSNAPEMKYMWTKTTNENNYAYDNEGVSSLRWELYRLDELTLDPIAATPGVTKDGSLAKPWGETITEFLSGGAPPGKRRWTFTAQEEFGIGRFKIIVYVTDNNGVEGDPQVAFFSIENNTTPTVKTLTEPDVFSTLWGDANGNFTISGIVQIQDTSMANYPQGMKVDRVSIVWIKPDDDPETVMKRELKYTDRNYINWNKYADNPASYANGYFEDDDSKVWEVPEGSINFVLLTDGNNNGNEQEDWEFSKEFNLFTDLDIGPGKNLHSAQIFLVRVLSKVGGTQTRSSVYKITTLGKGEKPKLTVDKITVLRGGETLVYLNGDSGFPMISLISKGDKFKVEGRWSDDSWTKWSGRLPAERLSFLKNFNVTWKGQGTEINFAGHFYGDGSWTIDEYVFDDDNEDAFVSINAVLTDLNNNTGGAGRDGGGETMLVETNRPTLTRISSNTSDGSYGEYKDTNPLASPSHYIDIFLEFNTAVKFFENTGQKPYWPPDPDVKVPPYLLLNNGGQAYYWDGNGDTRITFRYFVDGIKNPSTMPTGIAGFPGGSTDPGKLNVDKIVWEGYKDTDLVSNIENSTTQAIIHDDFFSYVYSQSLAGSKNIIIDKNPPVITSIVTNAQEARPYGVSNSIFITVNFNKPITVSGRTAGSSRDSPGNFYLKLKGGTLSDKKAKALYESSGASSVSFRYDVEAGDDTSALSQFLGVDSVVMGAGLSVKDLAANEIVKPDLPTSEGYILSVPASGVLNKNVIIDTVSPNKPIVTGIGTQVNNYESKSFTITDFESGATVEYHLDCPNPSSPPEDGWMSAQGGVPISVERNGVYNIVARQYDNAVPQNVSPVSGVLVLTIDNNPLLTRLSSSMPDGVYGYKAGDSGQVISIDLYSRIPLNVTGYPRLMLNVLGAGANNYATLRTGQTGLRKSWTFDYKIPGEGVNTPALDVTSLVLNNAVFTDSEDILVTSYIDIESNLAKISASNRFSAQKNIVIQAGYPVAVNTTMGGGIVFSGGNDLRITFDRDIFTGDTGSQLVMKQIATGYRIPTVMSEARWDALFNNRTDIWKPDNNGWVESAPAGWGSTDTQRAAYWQELGNYLYQKGSNGATTTDGGATLTSDTSVKYVLRYDVDSNAADNTTVRTMGSVTMRQVRNAMRSAEALRFNARDREVTITSDKRTLIISLTGDKALPVRGATYQWNFPNGFVKDVLGKPNGQSTEGQDASLTSGNPETAGNDNAARRLTLAGYENPVIRINKGSDEEEFTGSGADRQALQPLTSSVRIDCRTPDTNLQYRTRETTDNVAQLLWRNGASGTGRSYNEQNRSYVYSIDNGALRTTTGDNGGTNVTNTTGNGAANGIAPWALPNVGNQRETDLESYNKAKNRPQSGNSVSPYLEDSTNKNIVLDYTGIGNSVSLANFGADWNGMNHWVPMAGWPAGWGNYTVPFDIGHSNYNDGGMIIHISARINGQNTYLAYEAAYRSVFVFNNTTINGNGLGTRADTTTPAVGGNTYLLNLGYDGAGATAILIDQAKLPHPEFGRMWIRGGDTIGGDTSIPDFPIARDRTLSRKARIMTPIPASGTGYSYITNPGSPWNLTVNNSHIPGTYRQNSGDSADETSYPGKYLWFWVTWRINVNAYIDPFCGELPSGEPPDIPQVPQNYKELYKGIVPSKEHYPLIPGRTTVFETRRVNRVRYGGQGGMTDFGPLLESPEPRD